ncbi:MAG: U32 family peptidase [Candidatus Woesearchaeota archaeon]
MKIICPTNSVEETEELIQAGANEFYLGYVTKKWSKKYSHIASSNRRYFPESSFNSMKEIATVIKTARKYDVPVNFAINGSYYLKNQYKELMSQVKKANKAGVSSIIVNDIPLLLKIKKKFPDLGLTASTCTSSFNSESIKFYENLGVRRVILPRHLTLDEIKTIRKKVKVELEVLGLFDWCIYDDGMCTFHHGMENLLSMNHGCLFVNDYKLEHGNNVQKRIINNRIKNVKWDHYCAACLMKEFAEIGVNCFKVAGRRLPTDSKIQALNFIKESMKTDNHEELYFNTFQRRHPRNANAYM